MIKKGDDELIEQIFKMSTENEKEGRKMQKFICIPCGYIYDPKIGDPESGIAPGTSFENIPDDWVCPICFVGKDEFEAVKEK